MNVVSNKQVSNVVVSNERGFKWSGLKWIVSKDLVSIVCKTEFVYDTGTVVSDGFRIGHIGHGLEPLVFGGPAQLFPWRININ